MACFLFVIESIIETWKKLNRKGENHMFRISYYLAMIWFWL